MRPREAAGLGVKSVDRETALLFLTLREPGPLPAYFERVLESLSVDPTDVGFVDDRLDNVETARALIPARP